MNWSDILGLVGLVGLLALIIVGFRKGLGRDAKPNNDNWSADPRDPTP